MSNSAFTPLNYPQVAGGSLPGMVAEKARGYADGYAEGLRRAAATLEVTDAQRLRHVTESLALATTQTERALNALGQAVAALNARVAPVVEEADGALVAASLDLAEAIVGREVSEGRPTAEDALRRALAGLSGEQTATITLNPADFAALAERAVPGNVLLAADPGIAPGDAVVTLESGWLDARVGTALARARAIMAGGRP